MTSDTGRGRRSARAGWIGAMAMLLVACGDAPAQRTGPEIEPAAASTPEVASPSGPRAVGRSGGASAPGRAGDSAAVKPLVVWSTTAFWPASEPGVDAAGGAFGATLEAFQAAHAEIEVQHHARLARGPAGIGAFLQSTGRVVPTRLPDVALLPLDSLGTAGAVGLITPLVDPDLTARALDGYPFAAAAVRHPRGVWGVPVALDVVHAIGREAPPPATWSALRGGGGLVLPAGGADVADLAAPVALFGAAGGDLDNLEAPDAAAITTVLDLLSAGMAEGRLVRPNNGTSPRAAWNTLVTGAAPAALVSGAVFAPQQAKFPGIRWGPVPGPSGPARPIGWGWAWVVTAREPERVARAGAFIDWFTDPAHAAWVTEAGYLPAGRSGDDASLAAAFDPPPAADYRRFLIEQLETARGTTGFDAWGPRWAAMLDDVLAGRSLDTARARLMPSDL